MILNPLANGGMNHLLIGRLAKYTNENETT